jgi:succinoglycan biosynthesis protein ExoA
VSEPLATIIIAARPGQAEVRSLEASRGLDYPPDRIEFIVARGCQPSLQRNSALKIARGEIIYFLDDDSVPEPGNLRRALLLFADPDVKMAGGPNLCPCDAPDVQQLFALVMGSRMAFGPSCARYRSVGRTRATNEKELILCNLLARRDSLIELGGFNEALYPNEENALMDEIQRRGGKLIYDPALIVYRNPRPTLGGFLKMLLNYGRGRAEQFRLHPTWGSALNFVPPLFCLYLLALPFLPVFALWPLAGYFAIALGEAVLIGSKRPRQIFSIFALIFLTHIVYGLGFWRGLFTRPARPAASAKAAMVTLERTQPSN